MDRENGWQERAEKVINRIDSVFPNPEFENWYLCEEIMLSAIFACETVIKFGIETKKSTSLLNKTALYLHIKANYQSALPLYQQALKIEEKFLIEKTPNAINIINNIASLKNEQSKYEEEIICYQKISNIAEKLLYDEQYLNISKILKNLAKFYKDIGKYKEAIDIVNKASDIECKIIKKSSISLGYLYAIEAEIYQKNGS